MKSLTQLAIILTSCLVALTVNWVLAKSTGLKADFSAAGLHSNFARVDAFNCAEDKVGLVLAGSSITGRLLPEYFPESAGTVFNLGMDGGGVNSSLELFLKSGKSAEVLVVELNGLSYEITEQGKSALNYERSKESVIRASIPFISYQYRPSDEAYTLLKRIKDSKGGGIRIQGRVGGEQIALTETQKLTLAKLIQRLQHKVDRLVFVAVPSKACPNPYQVDYLGDLGFKVVKMERFPLEELRMTDQIHLNLQSAEIVSVILAQIIAEL